MSKPSTRHATPYSLDAAYHYCRELARRHYENFPVASRLLPPEKRDAVAVIYAFARQADDFADEGERPADSRLALLDDYARRLDAIAAAEPPEDDPVFVALADVIARHRLPLPLFHDLLSAFRQDVSKRRYRNFAEVLDYCRRSANPVGRLLLHLHGEASDTNLTLSDKVCSALQVINFLQDIEQDYRENNRIYLPQEEMARFGISEADIAMQQYSSAMQGLFDYQLARVSAMLREGAALGGRLEGRFGLEIRMIIEAGLLVLEKLSQQGTALFSRPRLARRDYLRIVWRALFRRRHTRAGSAASADTQ